jgi:AraC-like DNA-binding protein
MADPATEQLVAWRPPFAGVREVLHASHVRHAYPRHAHDTWTLFIVDRGAVRYDLGRHERLAAPAMVSLLPPHVAHDGRPALDDGYRMRVLYVEPSVIPDSLIGAAVDRPFIADRTLAARVSAVHDALLVADAGLEAETRLHLVVDRLTELLAGGASFPSDPAPARWLADAVRAALDEALFDRPSIADIATRLHVGPTAAARAFSATFGLPPHEYVLGRRLEAARSRILDGQPLAEVAAETGFVDQAHLTRRFKRLVGTTPGRYATSAPPKPA